MKLLLFFWGEKYSIRGIDVGVSFYVLNINVFARKCIIYSYFHRFWGLSGLRGKCVDKLCGQAF